MKSVALLATVALAFGHNLMRVLPEGSMISNAPTMAPTMSPISYTVAPTMYISDDERCVQTVIPPGVKPGSCMQVMCMPPSVEEGQEFNVTVRFCLQRPRKWHLVFALLDERTKEYFSGAGTGIVNERSQCAEVTFANQLFDATPIDGVYNVMWKFYVVTNHGTPPEYLEDQFPNMIAEGGVPQQPDYTQPLDPEDNCEDTGDMRLWNLPPTGMQDGIEWTVIPDCFNPGEEWVVQVDTHLESEATADLHCNLQIGTGGDVYLGEEDVYVTESNVYLLTANTMAKDWDNIPDDYWTYNEIIFTADQTALVEEGSNVYLACFLVPAFSEYDATIPGGWDILDREYYLMMEFCN